MFWGGLSPSLVRLSEWAFCPLETKEMETQRGWLNCWLARPVQDQDPGLLIFKATSFQLCHAASFPEGLGSISNCLQEICFTFFTDTAFQNQTPWKRNTEGVYVGVFRPTTVLISSWWATLDFHAGSILIHVLFKARKIESQNIRK